MSNLLPLPVPEDPLPLVARWLEQIGSARRNPNAMALATSDTAGRPSVRIVLLKELAASGYAVFYTNYGSRKATELERTGRAAAVLYWEELGRQVRFEGRVVRSPAAESDAYFTSRPWPSQLSAWSSEQSRPLADPAELERRALAKARELEIQTADDTRAANRKLPRPPFWGGYRLWFEAVELWAEGVDRFHERLRYTRELIQTDSFGFRAGPWTWQRLQP